MIISYTGKDWLDEWLNEGTNEWNIEWKKSSENVTTEDFTSFYETTTNVNDQYEACLTCPERWF